MGDWLNIPVKERIGLLREYKKLGYSYSSAKKDFEDSLLKYEGGGELSKPIPYQQPASSTNVVGRNPMFEIQLMQRDQLKQDLFQQASQGNPEAEQQFRETFGTSTHRYRYDNDPQYKEQIQTNMREHTGARIDYPSTDLRREGNENPYTSWMYGNLSGELNKQMGNFSNEVIGAALPIPLLEPMGKIPSVFKAGKNLIKGGSKVDDVTKYYHGSPWRWDKFDTNMIGKGEGAAKGMKGLNLFPESKLHTAPKFANINSMDAPISLGSSNKVEQVLLDKINPSIYEFKDVGNKLKLKDISMRDVKFLKEEDLIKEGFDGVRIGGTQITVFPQSVSKLKQSKPYTIEEFIKANPHIKEWTPWSTDAKLYEKTVGKALTPEQAKWSSIKIDDTVKYYHGGLGDEIKTIDDIDLFRTSIKQNKKGRDYSGFYLYDEAEKAGASTYAEQTGKNLHEFSISKNAKIKELPNIERVTKQDLQKYLDEGYDMIKGTDVRGRQEFVLLNKEKVISTSSSNPFK